MADNKAQDQPVKDDQVADDKTKNDKVVDDKKSTPDLDAFKAEMEKKMETFKKEIDGLNRRNSALEKERDDLKKQSMSEKERADYELKEAREATERAKREAQEFQLERVRMKALIDAGLDPKDASLVGGASEEEILDRVKQLKERVDALANARVEAEVRKRFDSAGKPGGGDKPGSTLTWEDINKMSEAEIRKLPPETLDQFFKK